MANILSIISIISFVLAGIFLVLAVFFWFWFNIPSVVGDLSGRTARKSIAKIREGNAKSGAKAFRPSAINEDRGKLTSTMPQTGEKKSGSLQETQISKADPSVTQVLVENQAESIESADTALLREEEAATTALLVDDSGDEAQVTSSPVQRKGKQLVILDDVVLIHTDEVLG